LNPTVSVIVRTVRRPQRLRECLQSLAAQTFRNFELRRKRSCSKRRWFIRRRQRTSAMRFSEFPPPPRRRCFRYHLTAEELRAKIRARDEIYLSLRDQAGPEFSAVRAEHLATEEIALAGGPFVSPRVTGRELRYEWPIC
jgi:hypothetical protein